MLSSILAFLSKLDDSFERGVRRHPLLALCLVITVTLVGFSFFQGEPAAQIRGPEPVDESQLQGLGKYLLGRPFIDKFPVDEKAKYEIYFFSKKGVAVYAIVEYYKEIDEFFFFKALLGRMVYWFPHSKLKGLTKYKLEECKGPGTFNIKLTIAEDPKKGKKERVYYSWKEFKRDSLPNCLSNKVHDLTQRLDGVASTQ